MTADSVREGRVADEHLSQGAVLDLYVEDPVLGQNSRTLRETGVKFGRPRIAPVPHDELPQEDRRRPDLPGLRLTDLALPFDLEEPPPGSRYVTITVYLTFDSPQVWSRRLSRPSAAGLSRGREDSLLDTRGDGRHELTWKLTTSDEQAGLRPSGREVTATIESPWTSEVLTGTLSAEVGLTRRLFGLVSKATAQPQRPLRFTLNVSDGSYSVFPGGEPAPGR